jgi:hypothetical protein
MTKNNNNGNSSSEPNYGSSTVTVACKLPSGVILQLHEMREVSAPDPMIGVRQIKMARKVGEPVLVRGYGAIHHGGQEPKGLDVIGGYALTLGISREFWEEWGRQNADSPLLKNRIIYAHHQAERVQDFSRVRDSVRTGLEPIDPTAPSKRMSRTELGDRHIRLERGDAK